MFQLPAGRPALMGILNVTPDSFSDGGLYPDPASAVARGLQMVAEGADLVDVGGESTRPGASGVSVQEELARVVPVVKGLVAEGVPVSIDTRKAVVAQAALDAGAFLVNDVSGLSDPAMRTLVAARKCWVCIMHMQGEPGTMQNAPHYGDVVADVLHWLEQQAKVMVNAGLASDRIWIDPGIGFGKTVEHNLALLGNVERFVETGFPVLIGVSRKSFLGHLGGGLPPLERLPGTLAAQVLAQAKGARIIRAHDVAEAKRAIDVAAAILAATGP